MTDIMRGVDVANISKNSDVRRSRPTFQLTNCVDIVVRRFLMTVVKGRPVVEEILPRATIEGNVQPVKWQEVMQMPEADRTSEWIKIYTNNHVVTAQEALEDGNPADMVEWEGHLYKVMKEKHYRMGILDHRVVYCAREPLSAGE